MHIKLKNIISILTILAGMVLLFYPFISEYIFEHRVDSEILTYVDSVAGLDNEQYDQMLEDARVYNQMLTESQVILTDPFVVHKDSKSDGIGYCDLLSVDGTGIMAYIEIPDISVYLPVYHGTSMAALSNGIGHLEGTSLPIGGISTHTVLTGHTGMNRAKLFTDLTELEIGSLFFIHVLGDTLAYQVCDINIVLPEDTSKLLIQDGQELASLVTCTPYGINTHRLLVTGQRVDYSEEIYRNVVDSGSTGNNSLWMNSYKKAMVIGLFIAGVFFAVVILLDRLMNYRRKSKKK